MILLIDNYDSFSYNLYQMLGEIEPDIRVIRNDAMTVEAAEIPYPVLKRCVARIIGEVPGVNRVVYDITGKPPGTIEWE